MFILPSTIAYCLVLDGWSDLWPPLCLANEVLLLGQRLLLIATRLLPRPINLYAFASTYLFSGYLTFSNTIHDLILIYGPFIPTVNISHIYRYEFNVVQLLHFVGYFGWFRCGRANWWTPITVTHDWFEVGPKLRYIVS